MSDEIDRIKAKYTAAEVARKAAEEAKDRGDRILKEQLEAAARAWIAMQATVQVVVNSIDMELRGSGLSLKCQITTGQNASAAPHEVSGLGRATISLEGTPREKTLVLNVSRMGTVRPVVLIPHTGKSGGEFPLSEADGPRLRSEIVAFLDQAVT